MAPLAFLAACKPWEDLRGPVSGVKVVKPTGLQIVPGDMIAFSGKSIDENGLTHIRYGIITDQYPWEGTNAPDLANLSLEATLEGKYPDFIDSVEAGNWAQGRVRCYSYVTNVGESQSDSNISYKYFRNYGYPLLSLSSPVPNNTFALFRIGDSVTVTGSVLYQATPSAAEEVAVTAQASIYHSDRTFDTRFPMVELLRVTLSAGSVLDSSFSRKVEMPLDGSVGQLYRLKVTAAASGREVYLAPGFQVRTQ